MIPLSAPAGAASLTTSGVTPLSPLPSGAVVGTNLSLMVNNQDPIPHGFWFSAGVNNVTGTNGTALTGAALSSWEANASWTFYLPDGQVVHARGSAAGVPQSDYVTVNATGSHKLSMVVTFTDSQDALGVGLTFVAQMVCPPSGGGTASTGLNVGFH